MSFVSGGLTKISAVFAGNESYAECTVSYKLTYDDTDKALDTNGDGKLDIRDVTTIINAILKRKVTE